MRKTSLAIATSAGLALSQLAAVPAHAAPPVSLVPTQSLVLTSFYGRELHGQRKANGERFDMNAMTAAHRTLPFGTRLRVTNPRNGHSVIVRVSDRGPFTRGRGLDVSYAAARQLGFIAQGVARLRVERL